jgi:midasin (ATPase involved in ribosome maturation)
MIFKNFSNKSFFFKDPSCRAYNFYKDLNITEAIVCVEVMKKLEQRVKIELQQWPEHAVLNDVSTFNV